MPLCLKNPNRDAFKGKQTLAFEPKMDREKMFQLVPTTFIVEASKNAHVEMIIIDELPFGRRGKCMGRVGSGRVRVELIGFVGQVKLPCIFKQTFF